MIYADNGQKKKKEKQLKRIAFPIWIVSEKENNKFKNWNIRSGQPQTNEDERKCKKIDNFLKPNSGIEISS